MSLIKKNGAPRWSPSYLRNRGHMSKGQKKIMRTLWPKYGITLKYDQMRTLPSDWNSTAPLVLEIGFGQGEHLLERAQKEPDTYFLGVEVHKPAIANLLKKIETPNIRIIRVDALVLLADYMPPNSLCEVCIFFPDPWPSPHNHHRRILRDQSLSIMAPSLKRGAHLHFATDVEEYAHQAYNTLKKHSDWHDLHNGFAPRPTWRPLSTYEHKGITEGRTIFDLSFEFRPSTYIEEQQKIQT